MLVLDIMQVKLKKLISDGKIGTIDIEVAIAEIETVIRNYCNFRDNEPIPDALAFTWANMAVDLAKYTLVSNSTEEDELDDISTADISALKMGDTSITLGGASSTNATASAARSHAAHLDQLIMNYQSQLNKFRRVVW